MNRALPPQKVLSQLEDRKANELSLGLAALGKRRGALIGEMEETEMRLADIGKQRELLGRDGATALQFSSLEAERRREREHKSRLAQALEEISAEESELKMEIVLCMSKANSYTELLASEERLRQKHSARVEQQSLDDLIAHRRLREDQA